MLTFLVNVSVSRVRMQQSGTFLAISRSHKKASPLDDSARETCQTHWFWNSAAAMLRRKCGELGTEPRIGLCISSKLVTEPVLAANGVAK